MATGHSTVLREVPAGRNRGRYGNLPAMLPRKQFTEIETFSGCSSLNCVSHRLIVACLLSGTFYGRLVVVQPKLGSLSHANIATLGKRDR